MKNKTYFYPYKYKKMSDTIEIEDEIILPSQEFINRSKAKSVANKTSSKTPKNKGTGAGGKNTNKNGLSFEDKTNNEKRLEKQGFIRKTIQGSKKNAKNHFYGLFLTFELFG